MSGRRKPRGPSLALVEYVLYALQGNPVTSKSLLAKTGRVGGISMETMEEIERY